MDVSIERLEKALGIELPKPYLDFVKSKSNECLRGFDPKTVLVLNLELRENDPEYYGASRLYLSGDGCGNYYFCESGLESTKIFLLAHDPEGIEPVDIDLIGFLDNATQENPIYNSVGESEILIAKTKVPGESVLNPIKLNEWILVLERVKGIEYKGYREMINPFTQKVTRLNKPGLAQFSNGDSKVYAVLHSGRISINSSDKYYQNIAVKLAAELNGSIFGASS